MNKRRLIQTISFVFIASAITGYIFLFAPKKTADDESLYKWIREQWIQAPGVAAIWPANTISDDDIELYGDGARTNLIGRFHTLRQQSKKAPGVPYIALADFIAPQGTPDFLGGFAVSAGHGVEARVKRFEAAHDDYSAILLKALADRLAEAFAEKLHEVVRQELWGYETARLTNEQLIKEEYQGIRPAPGYPACPEHTEKPELFRLLDATKHTGITLTESLAMSPAAAVSGWYFAGRGEIIEDAADVDEQFLLVVTPMVNVSPQEAFFGLKASTLTHEVLNRILPVCRSEARYLNMRSAVLKNDFEESVFFAHPEIRRVKEALIDLGAVNAAMSGSGATVFAIFDKQETRQTALKALDHESTWRKFAVATISRDQYREALTVKA